MNLEVYPDCIDWFEERLKVNLEEKRSIAQNLINTSVIGHEDIAFICGGTTCFVAADRLLRERRKLKVTTLSVVLANHYLNRRYHNEIDNESSLAIVNGDVDRDSGLVNYRPSTPRRPTDPQLLRKLVLSPRTISASGMFGDARDQRLLSELIRAHREVILLVTSAKLDGRHQSRIKSFGRMERDIRDEKRRYTLVMASRSLFAKQAGEWRRMQEVARQYKSIGVDVIM